MTCAWCSKEFPPKDGKRFCSASCRSAYHSAAKKYADEMVRAGLLTIDTMKAVSNAVDGAEKSKSEVLRYG
jgi:hypothetical protein